MSGYSKPADTRTKEGLTETDSYLLLISLLFPKQGVFWESDMQKCVIKLDNKALKYEK